MGPKFSGRRGTSPEEAPNTFIKTMQFILSLLLSHLAAVYNVYMRRPFVSFVQLAGPLPHRRCEWIKALTRITFQVTARR